MRVMQKDDIHIETGIGLRLNGENAMETAAGVDGVRCHGSV